MVVLYLPLAVVFSGLSISGAKKNAIIATKHVNGLKASDQLIPALPVAVKSQESFSYCSTYL